MKNNNRMFLDIHAIQTLPPSNINRDDTGSPKTAQYGGVRRARVSSQSWKKAMRDYFLRNVSQDELGIRTLEVVKYVAKHIQAQRPDIKDEEALKEAEDVITAAGIKLTDQKAKALFFIGNKQADKLAKAAIEGEKDKKALQEILKDNPAIDIALFGRMLADDPSLNTDATAQVAHAISTHAIENEFDFFTAVDDLAPEDNAGAGMLGDVEFNSSTLYRYANVSIHELFEQLNKNKDLTIDTLKLFVKAFSNSLPTGKVNSFANQTLPQLLVISFRADRPVSLVGAFEKPIRPKNGYVIESENALAEEFQKVQKFVEKPLETYYLEDDENDQLSILGKEESSLTSLLTDMGTFLNETVS